MSAEVFWDWTIFEKIFKFDNSLKCFFYSWVWWHMLWILTLGKQSRFLWIQDHPGLHEFQSSQELSIYSSINLGYMNADSSFCSQLLKLARAEDLWPLSDLLCQALCLPWSFFPLCGFRLTHSILPWVLISTFNHHRTVHFVFPKSLILPTSSDTNPH